MNRLTFYLGLSLLFGGQLMAQTTLNSFEKDNEVSSIVLKKPLFGIMTKVGVDQSNPDDVKFANAIEAIDSIRVFAVSDKKVSEALRVSVEDYVSQNNLTFTHSQSGHRFYKKYDAENKEVSEYMMFSEGMDKTKLFGKKRRFNAIFVQLNGTNIDMKNVSAIVEKLDLPKGLLLWNQ